MLVRSCFLNKLLNYYSGSGQAEDFMQNLFLELMHEQQIYRGDNNQQIKKKNTLFLAYTVG